MGFARFVGNYLFGQAPNGNGYAGNGWSSTSFNSLRPGDYIRYKKTSSHYGHSVIVASKSSSSITVLECNYDGNCGISWTRSISKSTLDGYYSVKYLTHGGVIPDDFEIDTRYPTPFIARTISNSKVTCYDTVNGYSVGKIYPSDDVTVQEVYTNGWVKGSCPWTGGTYKTVYVPRSVFINSSNAPQRYTASQKTYTYLRSSDSSSWGWIDPGDTCYSIYKSGNRIMVLYPTSSGKLRLAWTTNTVPTTTYSLDLNSSVNGSKVWDLNGIGTADVYINGSLVANDCSDFCKSYAKGTTYKITDIRAKSGYTYTGSKTISGTLNGNRDITLTFKKNEPSGWSTSFRMKSGAYTNAYDGVNGSYVGRVYPGDVVTIQYVYTNGWMKLSCPWDGGYNKTVYVKVTEFKFRATKYINAYNDVNGSYVGRVYPDDLVTVKVLYKSGWMKCVCPWDNGTNKTIYIKVGEIY